MLCVDTTKSKMLQVEFKNVKSWVVVQEERPKEETSGLPNTSNNDEGQLSCCTHGLQRAWWLAALSVLAMMARWTEGICHCLLKRLVELKQQEVQTVPLLLARPVVRRLLSPCLARGNGDALCFSLAWPSRVVKEGEISPLRRFLLLWGMAYATNKEHLDFDSCLLFSYWSLQQTETPCCDFSAWLLLHFKVPYQIFVEKILVVYGAC